MSSLEDLKPSKKKYIQRDEKDEDLKKIDEIAERYLNKKIKLLKEQRDN
jgi:hypothetical protein